jgi:quercetin dioxygenase-like cupin family protein
MDITAFIQSGILENYCLGLCAAKEIDEIETLSLKYPEIKNEIEKIHHFFETQFLANQVKPSAGVKMALMQSIYKQEAKIKKEFPPLITEDIAAQELRDWINFNNISFPKENTDNLFLMELPSTNEVTNLLVVAKTGHEPEMHQDFTEYLYIIDGSCTMNFEGEEKSYGTGDIITIKPNINHYAVVTSIQPMLALVQRQQCA